MILLALWLMLAPRGVPRPATTLREWTRGRLRE